MDQQTIMLAAIGDLEVTRRQLIMEIQTRDERIRELEDQINPPTEPSENGEHVGDIRELIK